MRICAQSKSRILRTLFNASFLLIRCGIILKGHYKLETYGVTLISLRLDFRRHFLLRISRLEVQRRQCQPRKSRKCLQSLISTRLVVVRLYVFFMFSYPLDSICEIKWPTTNFCLWYWWTLRERVWPTHFSISIFLWSVRVEHTSKWKSLGKGR
jgi:hypothetical protein